MNDNGIDADTLSSTMNFLMNGTTGNGLYPVDLGLEFTRREDELEIVNYTSNQNHVTAREESSEEDVDVDNDILHKTIKQASGNYSNAFIEERWNEHSEESIKSTSKKVQLKKSFNMLRESANEMSLRINGQNSNRVEQPQEESRQDHEEPRQDHEEPRQDHEEPRQNHEEQPEVDQSQNIKSKKKRRKFKNVAIESILGIQNISTVQPVEQENTEVGIPSSLKAVKGVANGPKAPVPNGSKLPGRGRGRFSTDNYRRNISMIRPECINGYHANPDYDPLNPLANELPVRDDFPPL